MPTTISSKGRRRASRIVPLAYLMVAAPMVATACESDDGDPPGTSVVTPGPDFDDSTTSSLPGPQATASPNPNAAGDGAPASTP